MKSILRQAIRTVLALTFCVMVALMILTDPLCAAVLAAGNRLRCPKPERPAIVASAAAASEKTPGD